MKNTILISILVLLSLPLIVTGQSKEINQRNNKEIELIGAWGTSFNENATFRIQQDSIYYPDLFKSFKYITDKDSLFLLYDGKAIKGTYSISNDSLFLNHNGKVAILVRTVDTSDLKSWIKNFDIYYKNIEKHLYDSVSAHQNDNIDFSAITFGLENKYNACKDKYMKTFLGYKLAQNYYTHFESSRNIEYRDKAKPLFLSLINFKNGEPASKCLNLDITKVHLIVNKWDSFSEKDQEDIMLYGLLRGFGNGLPQILLNK